MTTSKSKDIDEYIARFPLDIQKILAQIRVTIKKVVPDAEGILDFTLSQGHGKTRNFCKLLNQDLFDADLRIDCPEHVPVMK